MESLMNLDDVIHGLQDLFITLTNAKALVDDGKEVRCSQRLQGALVKCGNIIQYVNSFREDTPKEGNDGIVADQSSKEQA